MKVTIRPESLADHAAIYSVNAAAFGHPDEATLVDRLREDGAFLLSLIAEAEALILGHILFTRMWIANTPAVALAPMAVLPEHQRLGIGGELIREGLAVLRDRGERIVVVLGHRDYYPRFGFSTEKARTLKSPFPPEAYMALELIPGSLDGVAGAVRYPDAFGVAGTE